MTSGEMPPLSFQEGEREKGGRTGREEEGRKGRGRKENKEDRGEQEGERRAGGGEEQGGDKSLRGERTENGHLAAVLGA